MNALSHNLRRYRVLHGFSQTDMADKSGISRNAYRAIETGQAEPREENLRRIAHALGVSEMDLLTPIPPLASVRFRSHKTMTAQQRAARSQIVAEAAIWLSDFNELENVLNVHPAASMLSALRAMHGSPAEMAAQARLKLNIGADEPIGNICSCVENGGIKIYPFHSNLEQVFGFSIAESDGGPAIGVNIREDIAVERRIFTVAHELGHLILHGASYRGERDEGEPKREEKEANLFASHFLMPSDAFDQAWNENRGLHFIQRVMVVKRYFLVSYGTVLMRLIEKGVVDKDIWHRFRVLYEQYFSKALRSKVEPFALEEFLFAYRESKSSEPEALDESDFAESRLDRLVHDALISNKITLDRAAEILRVPHGEMRKRVASWDDDP